MSDVAVTRRKMRHPPRVHSVSAFAFNTPALALSINVMAYAIYSVSQPLRLGQSPARRTARVPQTITRPQ